MKIESITLKGFRCFGEKPTTVTISDGITVFVGSNGCGKTALLEALARVFGITSRQRTISRGDFYEPSSIPEDDRSTRELYLDVRLSFPELADDSIPTDSAVAICFRHMVVKQPNGNPFARIRLEARWIDDGTVDGEVEQKLWWILSDSESPEEDKKKPCDPSERGLIQVHYVPAARDASSLISSAGVMRARILKAVAWSNETKQSIETASQQIREVFGKEPAISNINQALASRWKELHNDIFDAEPEFNIASKSFEDIIRRTSVILRPTEINGERELDALSDGQKSLFYFSLITSVFEIEQKFIYSPITSSYNNSNSDVNVEIKDTTKISSTGFNVKQQSPALTIFAFEEPENHLSPYFLSRIITQIRSLVNKYPAQAVFTSHSAAILGRIKPEEVRHFRLDLEDRTAIVKAIELPNEADTAAKYVREAVKVYPELYFAKFVILVEGDSEEVVLPKLASVLQLEVDPSFVAIVPLGGRHVNYFWKLLNNLQIPHATLLDLDIGRKGAGWGRIKYVLEQLIKINVPHDKLLKFDGASSNKQEISLEELEKLHTSAQPIDETHPLINHLEKFGVFFSAPLDLDLAMLSCFPDAYKSIVPRKGGPRTSPDDATKAVLGNDANSSAYPEEMKQFFPLYNYLFITKSKPSTHLRAICEIPDEELKNNAPSVLRKLLKYTIAKLNQTTI